MKIAVENNYDLIKEASRLATAEAQYRQVNGRFDIELGAQAQYSMNQNPIDKANPSYSENEKYEVYKDNIVTKSALGNVYIRKLFSFGLDSKLSYSIKRGKNEPHFKYSGDDTLNFDRFVDGNKQDYDNNGNISLDLSMSLLKSFGNSIDSMEAESAKAAIEQMRYNLQDSISKVILKTSGAYWNYFISYKNYTHLQNLNKTLEKRFSDMDSLIKAGVRTKNDLLAVKINLKQNRLKISKAEVSLKESKFKLLEVLGIPEEKLPGLPEANSNLSSINLENIPEVKDITEDYIDYIISNRNDFKSLKKAVENANLQIKIAKTDSLPDVSLGVNIGTTGNDYSDDFGDFLSSGFKNIKGVNVTGTLGAAVKIGNNSKKAAIDKAEANYKSIYADFCEKKNNLTLQITNAAESMNLYKGIIKDSAEILDLHKTLYENEQKRFDAGLITVDDLILQDQNYFDTQLSYYQFASEYLNSILEFKYYTADLLTLE